MLPVGSIEEKARAARAHNATELLIPATNDIKPPVQGLTIIDVQSISGALERIL